jgi:hypothetical protein
MVNAQTKEQTLLINKTTAFYKWYKTGQHLMDDFELYKGDKDNNPPYHIQWNAVEKYFAYIRKYVPALGEAFIQWHRADFKRIDQWFKDNPTEEIPAGFDYERIVGGQVGAEEALAYSFPKQGKWKVVIKGNTATVTWLYQATDYDTDKIVEAKSITEFKKEIGVWKISKTIGMTQTDEFFEQEKKDATNTI